MEITLPDVNFDITVDYPDETGLRSWRITISLGGISLISRQYKGDYSALQKWRETHNEDPLWYAVDVEDAKEKCITALGVALRQALSAGSMIQPIG